MNDWKESAIKRANFRHTKADPEVAPHRSAKRGKKPWKLICTLHMFWREDGWDGEGGLEWVYNRYHTEKQALQGLKAMEKDKHLKNLRIEGPKQ